MARWEIPQTPSEQKVEAIKKLLEDNPRHNCTFIRKLRELLLETQP